MEGDPEAVVVGAIDGATEGGGGVEAGVEAGGESKLPMTPAAASAEAIECARYGEPDELSQMMAAGADVDHKGSGGNTALHMACANGHVECVQLLLDAGARQIPNDSGNTPLHWAVLNKSIAVVQALCTSAVDLDVLTQNGFGKSALSDAYGAGETGTPLTKLLLEHKSADKLEELNKDAVKFEDEDTVGGAPAPDKPDTGGDSAGTPPQTTTEAAAVAPTSSGSTSAADSKVVQSYTYVFNFSVDGAAGPDLRAREVATDWAGAVFGEGARAEEDTTGMQVWATALISSRWIAQLQASPVSAFAGKRVIELGAGAGVPGLCALFYSKATKVVLTDVFKHTLNNLRFNVALNLKHAGTRNYSEVEVQELDWRRRTPDTAAAFDVVLGSDLVYDDELVAPLLELLDHIMAPDAVFYMVAAAGRQGVTTLVQALAMANFDVAMETAPDHLKANPLASKDDQELDLHFNELYTTTHTLYTIRRMAPE